MRVRSDAVDDSEVEQAPCGRLRSAIRPALQRGDRHLDERALLGQALDASRLVLHLRRPLRMRDDRRDSTPQQQWDRGLECAPAPVRALDEEVATGLREREPAEILRLELPERRDVDLGAGEESHRHLATLELRSDDSDQAFHLLRARRVVGAHVGSRRDRLDAVARCRVRELERLVQRADAVVDSGQDVAVEVDHDLHDTMPMPRTVLHISQPVDGGVPKLLLDLARDQVGRGWQVVVAAPSGLARAARARGAEAVEWRSSRSPNVETVREARALGRQIREIDPDLVHLHSSKAGLAGRLALRGTRPTVFQPHAWSFDAVDGPIGTAAAAWERFAARWAHAIVCVSESERERGLRAGVRGNYRVIPLGLDLDEWPLPGEQERHRARERLGLDAAPLAVCIGRLSRQKGQDVLVEAWPRVAARLPAARLVLVGDGPEYEQLAARAPSSVQLAGHRDDTREWIVAADVVVVAARWEGLSYVMLEALATGRSVAATDVGGAREALGEDAGVIVPIEDGSALVDAVAERLLDPNLARAEGEAGRRRAERLFGLDRTARQAAELYEELFGGA